MPRKARIDAPGALLHIIIRGIERKAIFKEEEPYLKQLVGYIHLNPFRARIVETIQALETYPFKGGYPAYQ